MYTVQRLTRLFAFTLAFLLAISAKSALAQTGSPNNPPYPPNAAESALAAQKAALEAQVRAATTAAPVPNDDIGAAVSIAAFPYQVTVDTAAAVPAEDDPATTCGGNLNSNSVWYAVTAPGDGTLRFTTTGSGYDTVLNVFTGTRGELTELACSDDAEGNISSRVSMRVTPGATLYVEVKDYGASGGGSLRLQADFVALQSIDTPLDIVILQDETGSMGDDIDVLQALVPEIWDDLAAMTTVEFRIGVAGFRDFARYEWGSPDDWVYRSIGPLTSSRSSFQVAVDALTASGGADGPEAQYPALYYLSAANHPCIDSNGNGACTDPADTPMGQQPQFRSGARRVVLLATDAPFHDPLEGNGYPGPTRDQVISQLLARNILVFGLTPAGLGSLPQLDDLTAATGGATFSTGAQGQDIAIAIAQAVQNVQIVSPVLSSVELAAANTPADGSTPLAVVVTLRDLRGVPIANHAVRLSTNRPGSDWIEQPALPTDADGRTVGYVRSGEAGSAAVIAVDATTAVVLAQAPVVVFGPPLVAPGTELARAVTFLAEQTESRLDGIGATAKSAGESGDYFYRQLLPDAAKFGLTVGFGILDGISIVRESAQPLVLSKMSGILVQSGLGWQRIVVVSATEYNAAKLFDLTLREAVLAGDWSGAAREVLQGGWRYLAVRLATDGFDEVKEKGVEWVLERELLKSDGMTRAGDAIDTDLQALAGLIDRQKTQVLAGVPVLTPAEQALYASDMYSRTKVAIVLDDAVTTQNFLLQNIRLAHEDSGNEFVKGTELFMLKFSGKFLSNLLLPGAGGLLFSATTTAIESRIEWKNMRMGQRAFVTAPSILKQASESGAHIYQNGAIGMDRILARTPVRAARGQFGAITNAVAGSGLGIFWNTRRAYSDIQIYNAGGDTTTFQVLAKYSVQDKLFGFPYALLPFVEYQSVSVNPGRTGTLRIEYKDEEFGGLPADGSNIVLTLLAMNEHGTYMVDSRTITWNPVRVPLAGVTAAQVATGNEPILETPIDVYVSPGAELGTYNAAIWVSNPFTATITARITQTLPTGAGLTGASAGSATAAVQELEIGAYDVVSVPLTFRLDAPLGTDLALPPAALSFVEPGSQQLLVTVSNTPEFRPPSPVSLAMDTLQPQPSGAAAGISAQVTNLVGSAQSGQLRLVMRDAGGAAVHTATAPFGLAPGASRTVTWPVPANLRAGFYALEVWLEIGAGSELMFAGTYQVSGQQLFLPSIKYEVPVAAPICSQGTFTPVDVVLALDRSESFAVQNRVGRSKVAILEFLGKMGDTGEKAGLVLFNKVVDLPQTLTTDKQAIYNLLVNVPIGSDTAIGDAIKVAADELLGPRHVPGHRPVLIIFSDGQNTSGSEPLTQANAAKARGIRIFTVSSWENVDGDALRKLASSSADYYYTPGTHDMAGSAAAIAARVRCGD